MVFQASQKITQKMGMQNAQLIHSTTKIQQIFWVIFTRMERAWDTSQNLGNLEIWAENFVQNEGACASQISGTPF